MSPDFSILDAYATTFLIRKDYQSFMKPNYRNVFLSTLLLAAIVLVSMAVMVTSSAHAIAAAGPTASTWYFAEGRVGGGFKQFLTIANPGITACSVDINYLYRVDGSTTDSSKTVTVSVPAVSRFTESVNTDLHFSELDMTTGANVAAIVSVNSGGTEPLCEGIVVERPMYFYFHGIQSGTDTLGTTREQLNDHYYFADIPTGTSGESFLSILNPQSTTANVTVKYYANGNEVAHETLAVGALSRGTFQPNNLNMPDADVAAVVSADKKILVERPSYFKDRYHVNGAASVTGATALGSDWFFAEGSTGVGFQENLLIANLSSASQQVLISLQSANGGTPFTYTVANVPAKSQIIWNVNTNNVFTNHTDDVSAEVSSTGGGIVVQRQMFMTYHGQNGANSSSTIQTSWNALGATDTMGSPSTHNAYNFAEGFTSVYYNEWLLLQNPTSSDETVDVTLNNMLGHHYTQHVTVPANSRYTDDITKVVEQHLAAASEGANAYAVSMTVSSQSDFVAERTMYFHTPLQYETQGASSIVGFPGDTGN